jgi:hypothetical protein
MSQFLQHGTQRRFEEFKDWNLQEMWDAQENQQAPSDLNPLPDRLPWQP